MENLKLILIDFEGNKEEIMLPGTVNELFINNKEKDKEWVLNIANACKEGLTKSINLNFGELKGIWKILSIKIRENSVHSIEVYNNEHLMYTVNNINNATYVIDMMGHGLGERIGISFNYDE